MTVLNAGKFLAELRAAGLTVHEMPNWRSRGHGSLDCHVIGVHDSVTQSMSDNRAAEFVYEGRSDLPGPDYNLVVGGNGEIWLVSAVRSWNIGTTNKGRVDRAVGSKMPITSELGAPPADDYNNGNNIVFGFAFRTAGAGPYTTLQYTNGVKAAACLIRALGWGNDEGVASLAGHGELTRRKVDPQFDMGKFRRDVLDVLNGKHTTAPKEEDDMANSQQELKDAAYAALQQWATERHDPNKPGDPSSTLRELLDNSPETSQRIADMGARLANIESTLSRIESALVPK